METTGSITWEDYVRAERFLPWNVTRLMSALDIEPHWSADGRRCWYRVQRESGPMIMRVDLDTGTSAPAFDHDRLAEMLSRATGIPMDRTSLPFDALTLDDDGRVSVVIDGAAWHCDVDTGECQSTGPANEPPADVVRSPDGRHDAFARDHDLWIRDRTTGTERQVTPGGEPGNAFGSALVSPLVTAGLDEPQKPAVIWSPDSTRLLTCRIDEREALKFHLVQSLPPDGATRPRLHTYSYPLPGDEAVPQVEYWCVDVASGQAQRVDLPLLPLLYYGSPLNESATWWSGDSSEVFLLIRERGYLGYRLVAANCASGAVRTVVDEQSQRGIDPYLYWAAINIRVINGGREVVWYSHRDGWPHLYLYDGQRGELLRQLTSGPFSVSEIVHVDEAGRWLYLMALGKEAERDPYYSHLYRVDLDRGGALELLTPEDAEHGVSLSPAGTHVIDTFSRSDRAPETVLRTADGALLGSLETAEIGRLRATGWQPPERFSAKARDGVTDVYGVIFRPSTFDPARRYPVIDNIYGGPQVNQAPTSFADSKAFGGSQRAGRGRTFWQAQAIAELGFIVVMVDGLGMPGRSKAYHDVSYRDLGDAGLPDHISALRELADRYPSFDLSRVGIYGHSAGGYASAHAILTYPDFYRVCVSSAGNHDHRLDKATWVERYMGLPVEDHYREQANQSLAGNLNGKLLLVHGEMDENVHPASTLVLVDALIKENKDFDLLILPNTPHFCDRNPYFVRKRWDYFVKHLLGAEPPSGYGITPPPA
jgi:dipeptidyl aminopeptidase/acylaminoacyl peptidase